MEEVIKVVDCGENIGNYDIPIHNAIIVPKNATNGDVIRAMFPKGTKIFNIDWWNSPYKMETEIGCPNCGANMEREVWDYYKILKMIEGQA